MDSITITVAGPELEKISITLTSDEVAALYARRKDQDAEIAALTKKLTDAESSNKFRSDRLAVAEAELEHANTLLSALGIQEKTDHEESYYRKPLPVATRIALFIAKNR